MVTYIKYTKMLKYENLKTKLTRVNTNKACKNNNKRNNLYLEFHDFNNNVIIQWKKFYKDEFLIRRPNKILIQ